VNIEWVKSNKTYNVALGGGSGAGTHTMIEIHQYSLDGEYLNTFNSIAEAEEKLNLSTKSGISACVNGRRATAGGYRWSTIKVDNLIEKINTAKTPIYQYTLDGKFIAEFGSLREAAKSLGHDIRTGPITLCAQGSRKKAYGYIWKYYKTDDLGYSVQDSYKKKVYQYTIDGEFVKEWDSIEDASRVCGKTVRSNMSEHIKGNRKTLAGFIWSFEKI
jgi:hypothetical protein